MARNWSDMTGNLEAIFGGEVNGNIQDSTTFVLDRFKGGG